MSESHKLYVSGEMEINVITQQVFIKKQQIKISDLSYKTLISLIEAAPASLSNSQLMDLVWGDVAVSPETVTQRIALLRKSLSQNSNSKPTYITSVRGLGYRWLPEVKTVHHLAQKKRRQKTMYLIVSISLALLCFGWFWANKKSAQTQQISLQTGKLQVEELTSQAWRYMDKHSADGVKLAQGLFRKALELNPEEVNALSGLSISLSHQVTKFNQPMLLLDEASEVAERAIEINPEHAQAWVALAFVDDARGQIDKAIAGYEKALQISPDNSSTQSSLAYLYTQKGRLVDALRLDLSVADNKQLYLDLQIAEILGLLGFDVVAEQWFNKADVLSPDNVFAAQLRSQFYLSTNQLLKAEFVVQDAIDRGVNRPELPLVLGIIEWIRGDIEAAISQFQLAVDVDKEDMRSHAWLSLAQNHTGVLTDEALLLMGNKWFKEQMTWPDQWVYKSLVLAQLNQSEAAIESLYQAYQEGFRNHRLLMQYPPFKNINHLPAWSELMEVIQADISNQKQQLLAAQWLPHEFLNPK